MSTQPEHKHVTEAEAVPEGDLKGSDFFPPGSGWNEAPGEVRDLDLEQREKEAGEAVKRD